MNKPAAGLIFLDNCQSCTQHPSFPTYENTGVGVVDRERKKGGKIVRLPDPHVEIRNMQTLHFSQFKKVVIGSNDKRKMKFLIILRVGTGNLAIFFLSFFYENTLEFSAKQKHVGE